MSFSQESIQHIAHLARLQIQTEGEHFIQEDLAQILTLLNKISKANTEGIEPMAHPLNTQQRLREDIVSETNERDSLLAIAPLTASGLFLVPTVIE